MPMESPKPRYIVRLMPDMKAWISQQAKLNGTSQNAEILRAIRERMDRLSRERDEPARQLD